MSGDQTSGRADRPRISAVIPVRNNGADLAAAVASVISQPGVEEVLLCVGPSHDDSRAVAERLARDHQSVQVIDNAHGGIPQALNLGLAQAVGDILLRLDAHSVLPGDYVDNALGTMSVTGAANVGAVQHPVGQTLVERGIAAAMAHRFGSGGAAYRQASACRRVDTGFLGFFRIGALRSVGGWDDRFERNEDAELNIRLNSAGHQVWLDPRLVVEYRPRGSLRALAEQYFRYGWWRQRTIRKHPGSLAARQLGAPVIVIGLVASAAATAATPAALAIPAAYGTAVLGVGLRSDGPARQRFTTSAALATMHLSWGTGFLASALRSRTS